MQLTRAVQGAFDLKGFKQTDEEIEYNIALKIDERISSLENWVKALEKICDDRSMAIFGKKDGLVCGAANAARLCAAF